MNLVIQGEEIETPDLKELHRIARGEADPYTLANELALRLEPREERPS